MVLMSCEVLITLGWTVALPAALFVVRNLLRANRRWVAGMCGPCILLLRASCDADVGDWLRADRSRVTQLLVVYLLVLLAHLSIYFVDFLDLPFFQITLLILINK